ncbi:hypothetical protein LXA43DRAFT_1066046 [Ganoderma leucocontextum]|nr:hypothetical protein LXA43DRAFT_1066046 [Ganoderma leucocontextum]
MTSIKSILACDEIIRMTFQDLRPVYPRLSSATTTEKDECVVSRQRARHDLASAARVCRAFAEHALDALWEVLEDLWPLLKVLPSYRSDLLPLDVFSRVTADGWTRLHSDRTDNDWTDGDWKEDRQNFEVLLSAIHISSPALRELLIIKGLKFYALNFHLHVRHIQSLAGFTRLQCFTSQLTLDAATWRQLGSLHSLQHLDIRSLACDETPEPESYSFSLPDLRDLRLGGPLQSLLAFVEKLKSPNLHSVSFRVRHGDQAAPTPDSRLEEFFNLAMDKLPATLRKFAMKCNGKTTVRMSDEAIVMLSKALPRLRSLTLQYTPISHLTDTSLGGHFVRPTLGALIALAAHCPHLSRLHLADIDVDADPGTDVPALHHQLDELEFTCFRTKTEGRDRVFDFAEMLDRLFPHLVNVVPSRDPEAAGISYHQWSLWDVAKASLGCLQSVRRNRHRRARPGDNSALYLRRRRRPELRLNDYRLAPD